MSIETFLAFEISIAAITVNPGHDGTVRKTTTLTRVGTQMISQIIVGFLAGVAVHAPSQETGHAGDDVVMIVVEIEINSFLLFGTGIKDGILVFFGHDVDLVVGEIGLKLFDFVQSTGSEGDARLFMQFLC